MFSTGGQGTSEVRVGFGKGGCQGSEGRGENSTKKLCSSCKSGNAFPPMQDMKQLSIHHH